MTKTKRTKVSQFRQKIKRQYSVAKKYTTTYKDIKKYFKTLNNYVFENKLSPFGDVEIKDLARDKCIGQVITLEWKRKGTRLYKLEMLPQYNTKRDFLDTLVHEMVHLYQMQNLGDSGAHNDIFWSFEPNVEKLGLRL